MLFYDMCLLCDTSDYPFGNMKKKISRGKNQNKELPFGVEEDEEEWSLFQKLNSAIYNQTQEDDFYAVVYKCDKNLLFTAVALWPEKINNYDLKKRLIYAVSDFAGINVMIKNMGEITGKKFLMLTDEADNRSYIKRSGRRDKRDLKLDYYNNSFFKIKEIVALVDKMDKEEAINEAKSLMADKTLVEEIGRIYSAENARKFYGFPVHYKIQAGSREAALPIIELIVHMLYCNKRIYGSRINLISEIAEACYDEEDVENMIKQADGAAVVVELQGSSEEHDNYSSNYDPVVRYLAGLIEKYHHNTLFFFIENTKKPGFTKSMIAELDDVIDIIDIKEGRGNKEEALAYFKRLISESNYAELADDRLQDYLPARKKIFLCNDVHASFNKWSRQILRDKAYGAYRKCKRFCKEDNRKKGKAYNEFKEMVGLNDVKEITDQIISSYKLQKIKESMGLKDAVISKHMVFTGNPGSAKTTVARLLSDILVDEGVLETGAFVECGRADLIARYVGWTDKTVRKKFREARGGILFIDEAYSLVEDKGFGDEAINTIVQEMENHREEVIVIFAGYPDKMKDFLDKNEGLRSRIAFHLNFPDYNADELLQIMNLMLKKQGLRVDRETRDKCLRKFADACREKDFGNGRFVRNLIEHAMLKQAERLVRPGRKTELSKETVSRLTANDFDFDISQMVEKEKRMRIGFEV